MANIEIKELNFSYLDTKHKLHALRDINLNIRDGEFLCLIGASGCGKSTLLRVLAGLEKPEKGEITINGNKVEGPGTDRMIVFQDYALFPWMTALKNVSYAVKRARKLSSAEAKAVAEDFLEKVGMIHARNYYPKQLSGGMKQRVAIARALAMDTDILLLDEPFGALDARTRSILQELLLKLWEGAEGKKKTVVFVTHDINEALLLADRVVYMKPGVIAADIPVELPRPRVDEGDFVLIKNRLLTLFEEDKERIAEERAHEEEI